MKLTTIILVLTPLLGHAAPPKAEVKSPPVAPAKKTVPAKEEGKVGFQQVVSSKSKAMKTLRESVQASLAAYKDGGVSLDRLVTSHRALVDLESSGSIAWESMPGIFERNLKIATEIEAITAARVEAGEAPRGDLLLVKAHREVLAYRHLKARHRLDSNRRAR